VPNKPYLKKVEMELSMVSKEDLAAIPMFSNLTDDELEILSSISYKKEYSRDDIVIGENTPGGMLFIVQKGEVKIVRLASALKDENLVTHKDGEFFGGISLVDGEKFSASAVCITDTVTFQISKADFDEMAKKNPSLGIKLLKSISVKNSFHLRTINSKIKDMVSYVVQR
jgi:CRP-like cAMP-binding protein